MSVHWPCLMKEKYSHVCGGVRAKSLVLAASICPHAFRTSPEVVRLALQRKVHNGQHHFSAYYRTYIRRSCILTTPDISRTVAVDLLNTFSNKHRSSNRHRTSTRSSLWKFWAVLLHTFGVQVGTKGTRRADTAPLESPEAQIHMFLGPN